MTCELCWYLIFKNAVSGDTAKICREFNTFIRGLCVYYCVVGWSDLALFRFLKHMQYCSLLIFLGIKLQKSGNFSQMHGSFNFQKITTVGP